MPILISIFTPSKIRLILLTVMETTPHISPKADSRVVWLDVVRLIAMFTVVCCHCTDPFNFYPGTAPNIEDIKFWGLSMGRCCVRAYLFL